ncbi:MAG: cytochrome c peroxidase [Myxococcota bacterium]
MTRSTTCLLMLLPLMACGDDTQTPADTDGTQTQGTGGTETEQPTASDSDETASDSNDTDATSTTAGVDSSSDDDGSDGGETEAADGYPDEVTDALDLPYPPANYSAIDLPEHFLIDAVSNLINTPADNPITDDGATLGRVLFYDTNLSANATVACASCHSQDIGFTDSATLSEGFEGGFTGRNSMSLANSGYYPNGHFFWDERAETLEDQVLLPIQDETEMGMTLEGLVSVVSEQPYYAALFTEAFGDDEVTSERISLALSQFVRAMVSYQTRYDEGLAMVANVQQDFPNFSAEENLGKSLFFSSQGNCAVCHVAGDGPPGPGQVVNEAIFQPIEALNNGLDANPTDEGAGGGRFKVGSLRNVALTGPYMHDGRFDTLEQIIEHYDNGVQAGPNTDPRIMPGGVPQNLGLSDAQKAAIVAFMETLTDQALQDDPKFADPFL